MSCAVMQLETPVAFIVFNRPDVTRLVFKAIRAAQPKMLLVVADGPRKNRPGEGALCAETRAIINEVDWPCDVRTNFSEVNLGCKNRVASGIDWVFEVVPEAIFLEDDCLPDPSFFRFCEEMLRYYRDDERVGLVAGSNFQFGKQRGKGSYYFSKYMHIWGWASWRRAWKTYDREMLSWKSEREASGVFDSFPFSKVEKAHWARDFDRVADGELDTWDHQWTFANWIRGRLAVMPNVNLISNIGFGRTDATHTVGVSLEANLPRVAMRFPLKHPAWVKQDSLADGFTRMRQFSKGAILPRILRRLKQAFAKE